MASQLQSQSLPSAPAKHIGAISVPHVTVPNCTVTHVSMPPGSSWSRDLKAEAGTESCQKTHTGYMLSGTLAVKMDDGLEKHFSPGDVFFVAPGHDAWCVGDAATEFIEWKGSQ